MNRRSWAPVHDGPERIGRAASLPAGPDAGDASVAAPFVRPDGRFVTLRWSGRDAAAGPDGASVLRSWSSVGTAFAPRRPDDVADG